MAIRTWLKSGARLLFRSVDVEAEVVALMANHSAPS
jgi:hypothetical protein